MILRPTCQRKESNGRAVKSSEMGIMTRLPITYRIFKTPFHNNLMFTLIPCHVTTSTFITDTPSHLRYISLSP
jgi:hypothetical protein